MKIFKLFSLFLTITLASSFLFLASVKAQTNDDLSNALAEYSADQVDAQTLGIDEPTILPGDNGYWWQNLKENIGLLFTFNQENKLKKLEQIANRRLIEAKKLSQLGTNNAASRIDEALSKYKSRMEQLNKKLKDNPNISQDLLDKLDANQLRHQQVLNTVAEKIQNKVPQDTVDQVQQIKNENALNWYNSNQKNIQARLEKAIQNNDLGSKFKQLQNIATLEELQNILPEQAADKVEAAKQMAEARLNQKLDNINSEDKDKIEKYINNIKAPEVVKQNFISDLKDSDNLSAPTRQIISDAFSKYNSQLHSRFDSLSIEEKNKFLNQFENKLRSHPANLAFLQSLDIPDLQNRIQNLIEIQQEGIKEKIQNTTDPGKLRSLEQNLRNYPVLIKEIQDRQKSMLPAPAPNIRQYRAGQTDNNQ